MRIDPTAAAYGLAQLAFTDLTYRIATALLALRRHRQPDADLNVVPWQFDRMVKDLLCELRQFDDSMEPHLTHLRNACTRAREVARWRNARIHARVKEMNDGLAVFDWNTGERLSIGQEECEEKIRAIAAIIAEFQGSLPRLLSALDLDRAVDDLFASDPGQSTTA